MSKKIILLSDGTWQGAGSTQKTNVWRLYRALDLHQDEDREDGENQVAFYDDGVGAREFLPLKLLGGAFGWGLKRNVIELYKALCRTYEDGDTIYLFGFSRGAFTVRMLAGLIAERGLCKNCGDEKDLHRAARKQFEAYRTGRSGDRGLLTLPFRRALARGTPKGKKGPDIEFLGVWDELWSNFVYGRLIIRRRSWSDRVPRFVRCRQRNGHCGSLWRPCRSLSGVATFAQRSFRA